ncbi:MAG: aldo/keto reductase [Deltaproteobacteria bacterium]|nr:aldo/keto reductase [Deltaproteobacteria bacterium]
MPNHPTLKLNEQVQIPTVGFGTYLIANDDAQAAVDAALRAGYRHIDTAETYENERGVGAAIRAFLQRQGAPRDEVFVTTKLWPGNAAWGHTPKTYASTIESLNTSLDHLGLDHVDLYLIHAPFHPEQRLEQWRALVELRRQGKARAIGVSNFSATHIDELEAAGFPLPDANQIELHPWSQKPQLVSYLADKKIAPIAYSSLVPLSTWRAAKGHDSAKTDAMKADGQRADSPFKAMAAKYGVSEAQVLLRWAVHKGYAILPKSTNPERVRQNIDLWSFTIDDDDMRAIEAMDRGDGVAWSVGDPTKSG